MSLDSITWYRKQGVAIPAQNNKVLVRCITYNQSEYIVETLNGFGIQKQSSIMFVSLLMMRVQMANKRQLYHLLKQNVILNKLIVTKTIW